MANICENIFYAYSENPENIKTIKEFFENWNYDGSASYEGDDISCDVYFNSRWTFPMDEMIKLHNKIPDKSDIYMRCLSYEFGELYHDLLVDEGEGWYSV